MQLAQITSKYRASLISNVYKGWIKSKSRTLDIGCGTGVVSKYLAEEFSLELTGCDVDKYLAEEIEFVKMRSKTKLPFKNNEFSYSMFNDVLHHIEYENQIKLIKEAIRVSDQILIFELKPTILGKIFDYLLNKIHNPNMPIPYTYRTKREWEGLFADLGMESKSYDVKSPLFYPFTHVGFRLRKRKVNNRH